jgi:hypothetical protein
MGASPVWLIRVELYAARRLTSIGRLSRLDTGTCPVLQRYKLPIDGAPVWGHDLKEITTRRSNDMKKLVILMAMLAMLVVATVPALAQRGDDDRNNDRNDNNRHHNNNNGGSGVNQSFDQDVDSGDVDQSFTVTGGGDNSNQCVGVTGNANTGNLQSQTGILQYASEIEEFEQDDTGNDLTVEGNSTTTCDQQVNQAAAAG